MCPSWDFPQCLRSAVLTQEVGGREEGGLGVGEGPSLFLATCPVWLCLQVCPPIDKPLSLELPLVEDRQLGVEGHTCIFNTFMAEVGISL